MGAFTLTVTLAAVRPAAADDLAALCPSNVRLSAVTGSPQMPSACTLPAGRLLIETLYYQNASKFGGTALAAYPLVQLSYGLTRRLNIVVNPPSQIAESGLHGVGLYPHSHASYGVRYGLVQSERFALSAGLAVIPPASFYTPDETQSKYQAELLAGYRLSSRITLKGDARAATSHTVGVGRVFPSQTIGADIALDRSTTITPDVGERSVAARAQPQSFGDLSLKRVLNRKLLFNVGLGTTFNPVAHAKAHYLSSGFSYVP